MQLLQRVYSTVRVLAFDDIAARSAATLSKELRKQGLQIGLKDTFIAGICIRHQIPLLTRNVNHFARIENLEVITPENLLGL